MGQGGYRQHNIDVQGEGQDVESARGNPFWRTGLSPRGQPQALLKHKRSSAWPAAPEELLARAERRVALGMLSGEAEETRCVGLEFAVPAGPLCKVGFEEPAWGPAAVAAGGTHRGARARTRVPPWP